MRSSSCVLVSALSFFLDTGMRAVTFLAISLKVQASAIRSGTKLRCRREALVSIESPSSACQWRSEVVWPWPGNTVECAGCTYCEGRQTHLKPVAIQRSTPDRAQCFSVQRGIWFIDVHSSHD